MTNKELKLSERLTYDWHEVILRVDDRSHVALINGPTNVFMAIVCFLYIQTTYDKLRDS